MYILAITLTFLSLLTPLVFSGGFTKSCVRCDIPYDRKCKCYPKLQCQCYTGGNNPSYLITSLDLNKTIGNTNGLLTYPGSGYRDTCPFHDLDINKDGSIFLKAKCYVKDTHPRAEVKESRVELSKFEINTDGPEGN